MPGLTGFLQQPGAAAAGLGLGALASMLAPGAVQSQMGAMKQLDKRYLGPQAVGNRIGSFYNIAQSSPAYTNMLAMIFSDQNRMMSALSTQLGRGGLSKSAAATASKTLADSSASNKVGALNAAFYDQATAQAFKSLEMLMNGGQASAVNWKGLFAGSTIGALGDLLYQGSKQGGGRG